MKNNKIRFVLSLAFVCIMAAAKVTTDFNHSTDFSQYKTYSWLKVEAGDPLWPDRIRTAIDAPLAAKGMTLAPEATYPSPPSAPRTPQPRMETFYTSFGGGWYWRDFGDGMATTTVENIPIGTLVVDILPRRS